MFEERVQLGGACRRWLLASVQVCPYQSHNPIQYRNPLRLLLDEELVRGASDCEYSNLHLRQPILKASCPITQEVLVRRNAKAGDSQRVCNMPIAGLTHHLLSSRMYLLDCLLPLRMVYLGLRRLEVVLVCVSIAGE
jgi:hypothetical protein